MKEIPLTQGKVALVDDEDFDRVNQFKWQAARANRNWYAIRGIRIPGKKNSTIRMHCFILGIKKIDHRNTNGLDNQKENLRPATDSQNQANRRKQLGTSSKFKGVSFFKKKGKWHSDIYVSKQRISLGYYEQEEHAALAYNGAAKLFFGEFARLNQI